MDNLLRTAKENKYFYLSVLCFISFFCIFVAGSPSDAFISYLWPFLFIFGIIFAALASKKSSPILRVFSVFILVLAGLVIVSFLLAGYAISGAFNFN